MAAWSTVLGVPLAGALTRADAACDVTYSGPSNGQWNAAGNWNPSGIPTSAQIACIPAGKGTIEIANGVAATAKNVQASSGVQVDAGGSLAIADSTASGFPNTFTDLSVAAGASITSAGSAVALNGQVLIDGTLSPHTRLDGGTLRGTGSIGNLSGGTFEGLGGMIQPGGPGVVGTLTFVNQATFDGAELDIDLASDVSFDQISHGSSLFIQSGTSVHVTLLGGYVPAMNTTWAYVKSEGAGTFNTPGSVVPSAFGAFNVPNGAGLILNGSLTTTTTQAGGTTTSTTTVVTTSTTTTTLATCGNGGLDAGEQCDGTSFGAIGCGKLVDTSCVRCTTGCTVDCSLCFATTVDSFVLPKVLKVKLNDATPAKSKLVASGIFDTGGAAADLGGSATIHVGTLAVAAAAPARVGGGFVLKDTGFLFKVVPAKSGSSKARFRMSLQRDLMGAVNPDAPVTVEFASPSVDGIGTVRLAGGSYKLRHKPGDLIAPTLYLAKIRAKLAGGGKDAFTMQLGFATGGGAPGSAPDVTIALGPSFTAVVPAGAFSAKGTSFVGTAGPLQVTLDYKRELITAKAKNVNLGAFTDGPQSVLVAASLGTDARANVVRMVKSGKSFKY